MELENNKLSRSAEKFPDLPPNKNHGVFGAGKTLPDVLEKVREEYGHLSDEDLHEIRMSGHQVDTSY